MKTFKRLMVGLNELKLSFKVPKGEDLITSFDIGKKPNTSDAHVTQKGRMFILYVNGDKIDSYNTEKAAVSAAKDLSKLMDK